MAIIATMTRIGIVSCFVALLLLGCSTAPEPYVYEPSNELKPGRGLFSGEDGVFTVVNTEIGTDDDETVEPADADKKDDNDSSE